MIWLQCYGQFGFAETQSHSLFENMYGSCHWEDVVFPRTMTEWVLRRNVLALLYSAVVECESFKPTTRSGTRAVLPSFMWI